MSYNWLYDKAYVVAEAWMIRGDEIRDASEVREKWAHYLNVVEGGTPVTVTRRAHEPVTIVDRRKLQAVLSRNEELEEIVEVFEMMSDPEVWGAVEAAEAEIGRGEGLSFEDAFGESL